MADKVLIIEDEMKIARTVRLYLEQNNYQVAVVTDGQHALATFRHEEPDIVLLDLMLPNVDGWEICRQIRRQSGVPIIMLTARTEEADKLMGLELGADDYITKPFSPREVVARIRAVMRRARGLVQPSTVLRLGRLEIDLAQHQALFDGNPLELTPLEYDILTTMAERPGQVFTRLQLLKATQHVAYEGYERNIDQHIKNLRAKLQDDARKPTHILTVFGVGYRFAKEKDLDA